LVELLPVLYGGLFVLGLFLIWRSMAPWKRLIATLAVAGWVAFFAERTVHRLETRRALVELQPEAIEYLQLDGKELRNPQSLAAVLGALRQCDWFSVNHGGWSRPVRLRVTYVDGRVREFDVARYLREPGAVIAYVPPGSRLGDQEPLAFSPDLPVALSTAGLPLP